MVTWQLATSENQIKSHTPNQMTSLTLANKVLQTTQKIKSGSLSKKPFVFT